MGRVLRARVAHDVSSKNFPEMNVLERVLITVIFLSKNIEKQKVISDFISGGS